ncbi:hypothetical protein PIB30_071710 [Stylosanthes scabra]|uniref:Uncharacterized protein n=1 Tax=Stylosanthes scabra TaxID=79078 RepID=A0ABU6ZMM2_9FABA|nr:hypothetical protein [Stylosanthes scabra]
MCSLWLGREQVVSVARQRREAEEISVGDSPPDTRGSAFAESPRPLVKNPRPTEQKQMFGRQGLFVFSVVHGFLDVTFVEVKYVVHEARAASPCCEIGGPDLWDCKPMLPNWGNLARVKPKKESDTIYIEAVETLDLLKSFLLRTMGALGRKSMRRVTYRLLNILPPLEYKFKIFWLEGDVHVRAMFELHRRYGPRQVMELLFETRDPVDAEAGPSCARAAPVGPIAAAPLRIATSDVSADMDSSSEEGSDGEYQGETEESSNSFDQSDFVDDR